MYRGELPENQANDQGANIVLTEYYRIPDVLYHLDNFGDSLASVHEVVIKDYVEFDLRMGEHNIYDLQGFWEADPSPRH